MLPVLFFSSQERVEGGGGALMHGREVHKNKKKGKRETIQTAYPVTSTVPTGIFLAIWIDDSRRCEYRKIKTKLLRGEDTTSRYNGANWEATGVTEIYRKTGDSF